MDFDEDGIYYSHQNLQRSNNNSNNRSSTTSSSIIRNGNRTREEDDLEEEEEDGMVDVMAVRRHFREFLRMYRQREKYIYRHRLFQWHNRQLKSNKEQSQSRSSHSFRQCLVVDLAHLREYDAALMDHVMNQPNVVIPTMELASMDALQSLLYEQQQQAQQANDETDDNNDNTNNNNNGKEEDGEEYHKRIQILWNGNVRVTALRSIQSQHMNKLVKVCGIVISAAKVRSRATQIALCCTKCAHRRRVSAASHQMMFGSIALPITCTACAETTTSGETTPGQYRMVPDQCQYVDQQTLKLQEAPETVPTGEMPRSVLCCVDRCLVDQAPPGTRLTFLAVASMLTTGGGHKKSVYLQVVGLSDFGSSSSSSDHHHSNMSFPPEEEQAFLSLSKRHDIYEILTNSIAPSISGDYTVDVKKAILCMLMGGCRKRLPDGCTLRGDINVLLLGDPSMAKSQFLKYATRASPIGVYTSGKGSSAAGLTASVVRDSRGEFYLEGGAMVLADGGLVAIDEFDKMNPNDRVAIHEAMEQQTISVAKAGITTVLNSRTAVLAAANPVYGRYDDLKSASDNIDLMTTILSRFDLIFLLKDTREAARDKAICRHVMGVHIHHSTGGNHTTTTNTNDLFAPDPDDDTEDATGHSSLHGGTTHPSTQSIAQNAAQVAANANNTTTGELQVATLKKYIQYAKSKCQPCLTEEAGDVLASAYVKIRNDVRKQNQGQMDDTVIPITVRQLEALVRLSESLARMRLDDRVGPQDVAEALRLFQVSTMAAQHPAGGGNSNHPSGNREEMQRTEQFLQTRLIIGSTVNQQRIVEEAVSRGYNAMLVAKALSIMAMRGQLQEKNQGRLFKRLR